MDRLYQEIVDDLLRKLQNYSQDDIPYEELQIAFLREELAYRHPEWDTIEASLRESIFEVENGLYSHLRRVEESVRENIREKNDTQENERVDDVDVKGLVSHSRMISRNKMPLEGYSTSNWYLPFCPNHNHVEGLYDEEEEK